MTGLDELLAELLGSLPAVAGDPADGLVVAPTQVEFELPIEARVVRSGELEASLPRGRWASGLSLPIGRIRASFDTEVKP